MMLIGAFLEALGVGLMLPVMAAIMDEDIIDKNDTIRVVSDFLGIASHREFVIISILSLVAVIIIKNVYLMVQYYIQYKFIYYNRYKAQQRLVANYINRPYEYFLYAASGDIVRVINEDVPATYNLLGSVMAVATESVVSLALILTVFIISPAITLLTAAVLLLVSFIITRIAKPVLRKSGEGRSYYSGQMNKWILQAINGIKEIKVSRTETFFQDNFEKNGIEYVMAYRKNQIYQDLPRMVIEMMGICSVLLAMLVFILSGEDIVNLVPAFSAFAMAAVKILPSANRIVNGIGAVSFSEKALDSLLENLPNVDEEEKNITQKNQKQLEDSFSFKKQISLDNITYHYPNVEKNILDNANCSIPIGSSIGIIGPSGSGKTTTVDIILGLLKPQQGQVLCDGVDVSEHYDEWLSHIGYIPQMIFMLDDTIRANVAFGQGNADNDDEAIWNAIEKAQLGDYVRGLPDGLDTQIGERGIRVSGGQRQRIGIARALYTDPEILVFDEATSALDNETEAAIMESINALHGTKTMIIIAHRLTTIEECDIVYKVENGKIEQVR